MLRHIHKILFALGLIILCTDLTAQAPNVHQRLKEVQTYASSEDIDLFFAGTKPERKDSRYAYVADFERLLLRTEATESLLKSRPELIAFEVPGDDPRTIELYKTELFAADYKLRTSDNRFLSNGNMVFYHGQLSGDASSVAALSVFDDEIQVMFASSEGTYHIQKSSGTEYVLYRSSDRIDQGGDYSCQTPDEGFTDPETPKIKQGQRSVGGCVEIYFECDYDSYLKNGSSVTETEEWVAAIFNQVSILYANENIPIVISDILVWTTTDPYADETSTSGMLSEFVAQTQANPYEGRLAHLLSTRSVGGGIAYVNVLCSTSVPCAVSGSLSTNVVPFPNYSWNVEVVAHELGHNFGSRHTHACVWNGNGTQIDDCGNEYLSNDPEGGACYDPTDPILPSGTGGTVMSYCHLISGVGINFNNGFGDQPGDLIYNRYISATCTTGECFEPDCTVLTEPSPGANNVDSESNISWDNVMAANGYRITMGTSSGSSDIANNVDVGDVTSYDPGGLPFNSTIFVTIIPYNNEGDATDCIEYQFSTEAAGPPQCTQLSSPADQASDVDLDADLFWAHSQGSQIGYKINMGSTPGGTELLNGLNVGNVTSYDPGPLPEETTIYVQVIPLAIGGAETDGCSITSFTTSGFGFDVCAGAEPISCGTTVSGSTADAQIDDVQFCGTSVTAPGVWYTFEGDGRNVTLSMCGATNYDSKLSVYRGSCNQLICVGGNDDQAGCNYASEFSFTTLEGVNYYALVHGWNENTGNFNLTMACADPPVCPSQSITAEDEWISSFSLGDFTNNSGQDIYSDFTDIMIDVSPGTDFPVSITPGYLDQAYEEYFRIWADFNEDGDFDDPNEQLFEAGPANTTVTGNVTIPADISSGEYLLRVSMKYNALPDVCEVFTYGEVEEYTLRIQCGTVSSSGDSGESTLRETISCMQNGGTITFSPQLQGSTIQLTSTPIAISKDLTIDATGMNLTVSAVVVSRVFEISNGASVTLKGLNLKGGLATTGNGIRNLGTLTLENVMIDQHSSADGALLVDNLGELTLIGNCQIIDP